MRLFFIAHGASFDIFFNIARHLRNLVRVESISYSVTDYAFWEKRKPSFDQFLENGALIFEWEIISRGRKRIPLPGELAKWERLLGVETLWPAIVADRRTYLGRLSKSRQDYQPYFSLQEMQGILLEAIETYWTAFNDQRPSMVVGFGPAVFETIVAYWVARAKGIPYLDMRSTKIGNYVKFDPGLFGNEPFTHSKLYKTLLADFDEQNEYVRQARQYIDNASRKRVTYEGAVLKPKIPGLLEALARVVLFSPVAIYKDLGYFFGKKPFDTQRPPAFLTLWEQQMGKAIRARQATRQIAKKEISLAELETKEQSYVFFPLHTEPEIATSVFAPYHMNQIEVVRNIAQSVPMETLVVVKEHPRSLGMRPAGYYRKLSEIPNVRFVNSLENTLRIVKSSKMVVVLSSFVAFEAILAKIPAIILGNSFLNELPNTMVRRVNDWRTFSQNYEDLRKNYFWDERALASLIAAIFAESVHVNLWSELLGKKDRQKGSGSEGDGMTLQEQYIRLAREIIKRYQTNNVSAG